MFVECFVVERKVSGTYGFDCCMTRGTENEVSPFSIEAGLADGARRGKDEVQQPLEGSEGPHLKIPVHQLRGMGSEGDLNFLLGAGG